MTSCGSVYLVGVVWVGYWTTECCVVGSRPSCIHLWPFTITHHSCPDDMVQFSLTNYTKVT